MRSAEDIVALLRQREQNSHQALARMRLIRGAYNGDIQVPLPELDEQEQVAVPNLVSQGLDQTAMRIASNMPDIVCAPANPDSSVSEKYAAVRRKALFGWWEHNLMPIKLRRRARHLIGYATSPVSLRFDSHAGVPEWTVRDPFTAFPSPVIGPDDIEPADCVFSFERSWEWLKDHYPEQAERLRRSAGRVEPGDVFQLVEYVDAEETVLIAVGQSPSSAKTFPSHAPVSAPLAELERVPNRCGVCPVVVPGRVSLETAQGQFDQMIGMYQTQAKLMALTVLAVQKGIFPDTWIVGNPGETPQIVNTANGLTGEIGMLKGGTLKDVSLNPGFMTPSTMDTLERNARVTAGIPPEFGGESSTNVRTGRRGEAVLSAVVDFPVQEAQMMLAASLEAENRRAVALAKAYGSSAPRSFYVSTKGAKGRVDYTPSKHFDSDQNKVVFSAPGSDANGLVIGAGQRIGMGTMSKKSFMALDPMVDDAEFEHDTVIAENLEQALLVSLQTQASQGAIPPGDVARIMELVGSDKKELAAAIQQVHREAQERQAEPVDGGAPEAQPGIAQPGAGAEAPAAPGPAGPPQLRDLLAQVG